MNDSADRKGREITHGARIASHAETIWKRDTLGGQKRIANRFEDLTKYFGDRPRGRLLELGCGTGVWTRRLMTLPVEITAIDISPDLLALAERAESRSSVRYFVGDGERLIYEAGMFDFVCGLSILHHLHLPQVLREVFRVLRPGGRLWFSEPNMMNPQIALQKNIPWIKRWAGDTPDETAFFRWSLQREADRAGFRDVDVFPFDFLHPGVPDRWVPGVDRVGRWLERIPGIREFAGSLILHAQK